MFADAVEDQTGNDTESVIMSAWERAKLAS